MLTHDDVRAGIGRGARGAFHVELFAAQSPVDVFLPVGRQLKRDMSRSTNRGGSRWTYRRAFLARGKKRHTAKGRGIRQQRRLPFGWVRDEFWHRLTPALVLPALWTLIHKARERGRAAVVEHNEWPSARESMEEGEGCGAARAQDQANK